MRDMTKSSVGGSGSPGPSATRFRKTVSPGISPPIFSATRNCPVGVFMLPSSVPIPNRELEMEYVRIGVSRSEEHTSELQSRLHLVCRLLLEKKNKKKQ